MFRSINLKQVNLFNAGSVKTVISQKSFHTTRTLLSPARIKRISPDLHVSNPNTIFNLTCSNCNSLLSKRNNLLSENFNLNKEIKQIWDDQFLKSDIHADFSEIEKTNQQMRTLVQHLRQTENVIHIKLEKASANGKDNKQIILAQNIPECNKNDIVVILQTFMSCFVIVIFFGILIFS